MPRKRPPVVSTAPETIKVSLGPRFAGTDKFGPDLLSDGGPEQQEIPAHWGRGAHLNVRSTGGDYIVTLFPEEYDPRSPERAMRFANSAECQNFVSRWYMRESHDPRAMR